MKKVKLTYFNIRGKAEAIRLLLEDNQIPYEEIRIPYDENWKQNIKPKISPFKQLPVYEETENNLKIFQTQAIMRHLARNQKLYGKTAQETILCDVYQESITESRDDLVKIFIDKNFQEKREKYSSIHLMNRLSNLTEFFKSNSDKFCIGNTKTYVDYLMWVYLDYVRAFDLKRLEEFPELNSFRMRFSEIENISNYLKSERRPKVYTLPFMYFGNTIEDSK
eukprot:gene11956-5357_t